MASCAACLSETGLEPSRLELEITEGIILQNTDAVLETLTRLDQLGVSIAMDDFGTGYSSLSYLTRFPVKKIKIDRSFIDTLGTSPQTSAIVSSIVGLGQSLNVTITAEGVETEGQAAMLRKWGCDQVQGFYYGKPEADVPESEEATAKPSLGRLARAPRRRRRSRGRTHALLWVSVGRHEPLRSHRRPPDRRPARARPARARGALLSPQHAPPACAGAHEAGSTYYPVVAATHLAWIAAFFFLIPPTRPSSGRSSPIISCSRSCAIG